MRPTPTLIVPMRVVIANMTSALVHGLAIALVYWVRPEQWLIEQSVRRGEPILVQMSFASASSEVVPEVEIDAPELLEAPPHEPPPPLEVASNQPPTGSHELPPIDVVPTGKEPPPASAAEPSEATAVEKSFSDTPPKPTPQERRQPQETSAKPPDPKARKTPRKVEPAPVVAQNQAVAMPFQTATALGANVDEMPRQLANNAAPIYPSDALLSGIQGRVMLRVLISDSGIVEDAAVQTSSGSASLDESALAAVRRWKFFPARRSGIAVAHEVIVPVRFSIRRG